MITENMIKKGLQKGIILITESPHDNGVVCSIGENWFYFGGSIEAETPLAAYKEKASEDDMAKRIFKTLEDFPHIPELEDEYLYYESVLNEDGITANSSKDMKKNSEKTVFYDIDCRMIRFYKKERIYVMTRRIIVYKGRNADEGTYFVSQEFNGDREEALFFNRHTLIGINWDDVVSYFDNINSLHDFRKAVIRAENMYTYENIYLKITHELPRCEEIWMLIDGKLQLYSTYK